VGEVVVEDEVRVPAEFNPKLDSALNQLLEIQRTDGKPGARAFAESRQMVLEGDRVQVILVTEPAAIPGLAQSIVGLGGETQGHYEGQLQGLVPIDALEPLADRSEVHVIRDPSRAVELELSEAGSATTEGVVASNAAAWHSAGYNGTGVRVAVIDGGFTDYTTLLGSDLPGSVATFDWVGSGMGGTVHGTACAEVVHDMAPAAAVELHKISTNVDLNQAVTQAIANGADVISLSMGWNIDGPGDGTGAMANLVNTARANGIFFAAAAGNSAERNWAGTYDDSGTSSFHAWDGGSTWYNFMGNGTSCHVFPAGTLIRGGLHWDDWTAVNQDYDLHLYRSPGDTTLHRVASSTDSQNGGAGQRPVEYLSYTAAGGNCYAWVVERVNSNRNVCMRLLVPKAPQLVYGTPGRSVSFPADSPDAIAVGAVDVYSPYPLEDYSSQGPTFGPGGACSGGAIKPDVASYANVSTVSYGPGYFNGTSAATPHVAGAAALVKQRYPTYSVTHLQNYLENAAMDLGVAGKDNLYGSGRLILPDNAPPTISGLPDQTLLVNTSRDNAIDLWAYAGDAEDSDSDLAFAISNSPDSNAGVSVDSSRYIDINPFPGWAGTTSVEIQVQDTGALTDTDTFQVMVVHVSDYVYLPLVRRRWPPPARLPPLMDADVIQGFPSDNFGGTTDMWVGYDHCVPAGIARSLAKFDVSGIPAGTPISNARLYLYLWSSCDIGERNHWVTAYRVTSSWSSSSVTWNTQPGYGEAYGSALVPSRTWGWYSIDVTDLLQKWVDGTASNYGLVLRSNESSGDDSARLGFLTMNYGGTSLDPFIHVTYAGMGASGDVVLPAVGMPEPGACRPSVLDAISETSAVRATGLTGYAERTFCPSE
jgi:hypothetical protein